MRATTLAMGLFLLAVADAAAQPATFNLPDTTVPESDVLRLPQSAFFPNHAAPGDSTIDFQALNPPPLDIVPLSQTLLSVGAFKMRLGTDEARMHFVSYGLEDRQFLGGNLSGTLDARAATIRLSWPTGN
ncbi:MAG: hypothetical protein ACLQUZ_09310 [Rhizomicrobium sp.]